jgi:hypothetical protein
MLVRVLLCILYTTCFGPDQRPSSGDLQHKISIQYWNNLLTQQSVFSAKFYCALLTLHVSALFGGHLQVVRKHKIV